MAKSAMRIIREDILKVPQEDIIRAVRGISVPTYANAERGKRVTYGTATRILEAFNRIAKEKGRQEVYTLDDLKLNLY